MPIPNDTSLSILRARFERAVAQAEKDSSKPDAPALDTALREREAFEKLVSTTPQMNLYRSQFGVSWNERFTPVAVFAKQSFFGLEGKALMEHLWRKLPNSRFKRFQEAFCDPADYAIPKPNLQAPCVEYPSREALNTCSLSGCLVNPTRVPFKFLIDLGIVSEPTCKLSDLEVLAIKSDPVVIQTLKAIWASSTSLAPHNNRFTIVHSPREDTSRYYPDAKALSGVLVGSLIYTRENVAIDRSTVRQQRGPWTAPQLIPAIFSSVYAARRKTEHQNSTYQLETITIGALAVEWNELTARARAEWRRATPAEVKTEIRDALVRLVSRSRAELSNVDHHLKQQAAEKFEALETQLSSGSNNITSFITAVNAAVNRLEKRLNQVSRKSGHNTVDCEDLTQIIMRGEHAFALIGNSLFSAGSRLRDEMTRREGLFGQPGLSDEQKRDKATIILSRMKIPFAALNQVPPVRPLRAFEVAHRMAAVQLKNSIIAHNAQGASEALAKLVIFSKLQRANSIFELLRSLTRRSEAVPLKDLQRHARALRGVLEARSAFPYSNVPKYKEVYRNLHRTVSTIAKGLERYEHRGLDLDERTQMYSRLRAYLDKTDLEAYTNELVATDEDFR
jgi:hypothetical protein